MATINKKLIHFERLADFEARLAAGDILYRSIVWIKDAKKIWTHGTYYADGEIDFSDYLTKEEIAELYATAEALEEKQDKSAKFENVQAVSWVSDLTYADFPYRCDLACPGVTSDDYADVTFALEQAASGMYAPLCETRTDTVCIWGAENKTITIPTILITR